MKIFQFLRDWSEVWALLIPLAIILLFRPRGPQVKWLIVYVILAFLANFLAAFTIEYYYLVPEAISRHGNNIFYNIHSFLMTMLLGWYFISIRPYKYKTLLQLLLASYLLFVIIDFAFFESAFILSTRHYTVGSILLLIVCLWYFFFILSDDSRTNWTKDPSFIIALGLCLYQAITFFIFLFLYPLFSKTADRDLSFAEAMMRVYQAVFVLFCILLAIGLYKYRKNNQVRRQARAT